MLARWTEVMPAIVIRSSWLAALLAWLLQSRPAPAHTRTTADTSTAACERAAYCASSLLSFIFFMQQLTVVGIVNASAADRQRRASLHTAQHRQRRSANGTQGVVRQTNVHVAVCD
jgi:hypothetical protein